MKRRLFTVLSALSLLLCVAMLLLWRTTLHSYALAIPAKGSPNGIRIGRGTIVIIQRGHIWDDVSFPLIAAVLSLLPLLWLLVTTLGPSWNQINHWGHPPHRDKQSCPSCGYDLRATPDRCPECGAVPSRALGPRRGS
jgi:hypothetical protein